jgi:hypothetical protein
VSDRLALAHAIEEAGIERAKAEGMATAIASFVTGSVATKADLQAQGADLKADVETVKADVAAVKADVARVETSLKADVTALRAEMKTEIAGLRGEFAQFRGDMRTDIARLDSGLERLRATVAGIENRLLLRLGAGGIALLGLLFAALHMWPAR